MKKIKQRDYDELVALAAALPEERDAIIAAFDEHVKPLIEALNEKRQAAYDKLDGLASDADEYYEGRSESWQEGEKGDAYSSWKTTLESVRDAFDEELTAEFDGEMTAVQRWADAINEELTQSPEE